MAVNQANQVANDLSTALSSIGQAVVRDEAIRNKLISAFGIAPQNWNPQLIGMFDVQDLVSKANKGQDITRQYAEAQSILQQVLQFAPELGSGKIGGDTTVREILGVPLTGTPVNTIRKTAEEVRQEALAEGLITPQNQGKADTLSVAGRQATQPIQSVQGGANLPSQIPFKAGLSAEQQLSITNLTKKPTAQWTATDKTNWNYATNNATLPNVQGGPTPVNIPFKAGLSDTQKQSIQNLVTNKPKEQWTATDKTNYNYATGQVSGIENMSVTDFNGGAFNPPAQNAGQTIQNYATGAQGAVDTYRKTYETQLKTQLDTYQKTIDDLNKKITDIEAKETTALGDVQTLTQPFREQLEETERVRLKVEENYFANQLAVAEMETLMTTLNADILQQQGVTGLASIRSPRITETINNATARIGTLQAVIALRNDQISTAFTLIDRTTNAINADRQDQIVYYNSLLNFYDSQKTDIKNLLTVAMGDKKDIINAQINLLQSDLVNSEATAKAVKDLMLDPANAIMLQQSGITLNDSVETINTKMANWQAKQPVEVETQIVTAGGRELLINKNTGETIKDLGGAYKANGNTPVPKDEITNEVIDYNTFLKRLGDELQMTIDPSSQDAKMAYEIFKQEINGQTTETDYTLEELQKLLTTTDKQKMITQGLNINSKEDILNYFKGKGTKDTSIETSDIENPFN